MDDNIPYLLLTPGPLTTTRSVKETMLRDYGTWDDDYNSLTQEIRARLAPLAGVSEPLYTSVLMQGSGTFLVEGTLGSVIPPDGKALIVDNGAYGARMATIAERLGIQHATMQLSETEAADPDQIADALAADSKITHVAVVHCETTTGLLNPATEIGKVVSDAGRIYFLDALSSFGGIEMKMDEIGAHYLVSSAHQCIQGTPGFAFLLAHRPTFERAEGYARSLSLDMFAQWKEMEAKGGKWRYTSPTHVVRAFLQALRELDVEGGVAARAARYAENHRTLIAGMRELGFRELVAEALQSTIITAFHFPADDHFTFQPFYQALKRRRFVIYPGKAGTAATFRIGTIGHVFPEDIRELLAAIGEALGEIGVKTPVAAPRE